MIIRALRDYFRSDIGVIQIDEPVIFEQAREFIEQTMPQNLRKLKLYQDQVPLFTRFQIEHQIETAFQREVNLPSGGGLAIDHTEALISIDINSARSTKGADIEETAFHTNLEAADEIARQLRLRDIGGLIVVDFIDMMSNKHQREVEQRLREAVKMDRARVQIGRISRFGLLEMSRQRLQPSLGESASVTCPRCLGHGTIRSLGSLSLTILRVVSEEAMKDGTERVIANVPVQVATYLLNEKREQLNRMESQNDVHILVIPDPSLETPHYRVERVRKADSEHESHSQRSYELAGESGASEYESPTSDEPAPAEEPAVKAVRPSGPAPQPQRAEAEPPAAPAGPRPGLLARITQALFPVSGTDHAGAAEPASAEQPETGRAGPGREKSAPAAAATTATTSMARGRAAAAGATAAGARAGPGPRRRPRRGRQGRGRAGETQRQHRQRHPPLREVRGHHRRRPRRRAHPAPGAPAAPPPVVTVTRPRAATPAAKGPRASRRHARADARAGGPSPRGPPRQWRQQRHERQPGRRDRRLRRGRVRIRQCDRAVRHRAGSLAGPARTPAAARAAAASRPRTCRHAGAARAREYHPRDRSRRRVRRVATPAQRLRGGRQVTCRARGRRRPIGPRPFIGCARPVPRDRRPRRRYDRRRSGVGRSRRPGPGQSLTRTSRPRITCMPCPRRLRWRAACHARSRN
ncbi:MAG: ribonuclease E/G [Halofilum sp. (in: g-proteobacteria)]|nr:ribonuclease E/G [Halofilum sp. (in: g-proteobacteria)]